MGLVLKETVRLNDEIDYTEIIDTRYHLNAFKADFYMPFTKENLYGMMFLTHLFPYGDPACDTKRKETLWGMANYDPVIETALNSAGDFLVLTLHCEWLDDACVPDGESVTDEVLSHIRVLLFAPETDGKGYAIPEFEELRDILANNMEYEEYNPLSGINSRINRICFRGEPSETEYHIPSEEAREITPEAAYQMLQTMLREAQIRIYATLAAENPAVLSWMQTQFGAISRRTSPLCFVRPSRIKEKPENVCEQFDDFTQSIVAVVYKYEDAPMRDIIYLCDLLDIGPESLLFQNLREKHSLCYSCGIDFEPEKHTVTVTCQTDREHIDEVIALIEDQIEILRNGTYPEELVSVIVKSSYMERVALWDRFFGFGDYVRTQVPLGLEVRKDFAEYVKYTPCSRETVMQCAKQLVLDTVYAAEGLAPADEEEEPDDDDA